MLAGFYSQPGAVIGTGIVVALSGVLWVAARNSRWGTAVGWSALALAGQACSLQLLWAGRDVRPQVFYGWSTLLHSLQGLFLLALAIQAAIVLWGGRHVWWEVRAHLRRMPGWPLLLGLVVLEAYAATSLAPEFARALSRGQVIGSASMQASKVLLGLLIMAVGAGNLVLATAAIPEGAVTALVSRWRTAKRRRLVWWCALWVVVVSSLLAWFALERLPHVPDELAYLFQAKYFSAGHLYLSPGPSPQALESPFQFLDGGRWYNSIAAGWSFVLALGVLAGVPWLVNPLLGGAAILLAHQLMRRLYGEDVADGVALLLAASPWLLFLSASYMNHALALVCALGALLGVSHAREKGGLAWAAVAGLSIGALLHVRALEAVIVSVVAGVWWLSAGWRKLRVASVVMASVCTLAMAGLYLAYDKAVTGDAFQVPFNKYTDTVYYKGSNRLGFGRDVGNWGWYGLDGLPGHGPIDVFMNTNQNLYMLNFEMFGWACGSLVSVFLLGLWKGRRGNGLMWGLLAAIWGGLSLYWFSGGPDFGARYWYLMILPLAALTVRGVQAIAERLRGQGIAAADSYRVWAFVVLASALGMFNLLAWRSVDKYRNYRGMRRDIPRLERTYKFGRSLVFVRGSVWPHYARAFTFNPPTFDRQGTATIYVRDLGPDSNERLRAYYADRPVWVLGGGEGMFEELKVIAGPLPPQSPAAQEESR